MENNAIYLRGEKIMTPPHALTREQVEYICAFLVEEHLSKDASTILAHDAALRATIEQQAQEIERLKQEKNAVVIELYRKLDAKDEHLATLQTTLAARERDIDKLKADLNEMWVDDKGTVWTKPTAWAYAMVCKARDKHAHDAARLRGILQAILNADERGQGLPFQEAMQEAQRALKGDE